jgi:hypothetical protein
MGLEGGCLFPDMYRTRHAPRQKLNKTFSGRRVATEAFCSGDVKGEGFKVTVTYGRETRLLFLGIYSYSTGVILKTLHADRFFLFSVFPVHF